MKYKYSDAIKLPESYPSLHPPPPPPPPPRHPWWAGITD